MKFSQNLRGKRVAREKRRLRWLAQHGPVYDPKKNKKKIQAYLNRDGIS